MIASLISTKRINRSYFFIFITIILIMSFILLSDTSTLFNKYYFLVDSLSHPIENRVRYRTIQIILSNLYDSYFFGWGSLSLQWNNGFHSFYGDNFYLSDVAIFGTIYRHGFFSIFFILFFIKVFIYSLNLLRDSYIKSSIKLCLITFCLFSLVSGKIEYAGSTFCIILALCAAYKKTHYEK